MKHGKAVLLYLIAGALLLAGARLSMAREHSTTQAPRAFSSTAPGRIQIRFSPVLGVNAAVTIRIDGKDSGAITKGHIFERYLTPGRHFVDVSRNGRPREETRTIVDVSPGQTYSYIAKFRVNEMILVPAGFR